MLQLGLFPPLAKNIAKLPHFQTVITCRYCGAISCFKQSVERIKRPESDDVFYFNFLSKKSI